MDFHHILPSNTSPNYFPNNNASEYFTPVENPYVLTGDWEVGLIDMTYSSCINTFNNDKITIEEKIPLGDFVRVKVSPVKVLLPVFPQNFTADQARESYVAFINKTFETLLSVKLSPKFATWNLLTDNYYFIFSRPMQILFELWTDVLTKLDANFNNQWAFEKRPIPNEQSDTYIIIVPVQASSAVERVDITLKAANEKITIGDLLQRFKSKVPSEIATLNVINTEQFILRKENNDNKLLIVNRRLRRALTFIRSGMYIKGVQQYLGAWFTEWDKPWIISFLTLKKIISYQGEIVRKVILPPCSFKQEQDAIRFVNEKVNDNRITFACDKKKRINLYIKSKKLTVTFDDNLRDIFAFDKNSYSGPNTYTASGVFSLWRRIQYLYIYSNLTEYIRVGNTESPLLAIVPMSHTDNCNLLTEKIFKTPMYIKVCRDRISQIDIAIYDGAGQLVPFVSDAVTTLHLHFRQS